MDELAANMVLDALVGVHNGEYCNKPNNPNIHSMFKTLYETETGNTVSGEHIPKEWMALTLIDVGKTLLGDNQ